MGDLLRDFLTSGKKLVGDTKLPPLPKPKGQSKPNIPEPSGDPHKMFIRRTIQERPKKAEVVEEFKRFIKVAEDMI